MTATSPPSNIIPARFLLWTFVLTTIVFPQFYQPALSTIWTTLYLSPSYRLSTFETILTVLSYAFLEPWYTYKFGHNPELRIDVRDGPKKHAGSSDGGNAKRKVKAQPKLPKMKRPSKRLGEMILYVTPLLLMDLTMIKKFADVPLNDIRVSGGYAPLPAASIGSQNAFPASSEGSAAPGKMNTTQSNLGDGGDSGSIHAFFLLPTLHNFTFASPLQLTRALPPTPPTSRRLCLELLTSIVLYDMLFFTLHLSLHTFPILARIHLPHHTHPEIHPQVTNRLSTPERLSLVLLANFSLNIIGSHVLTRTLFVPIFVDLLIEVHCGLDLPYGYEKFLPKGWGLGSREHARHHKTSSGSYAPFFAWWDGALEWVIRMRKTVKTE